MNERSASTQASTPSKVPSLISLILGIVALLSGLVPFVSVPLGIIAIILGVIGRKRRVGKGMAVGGIVTGAIGTFIGLVAVPLFVFLAIPALQKNQADIQVKNDATTVVAGINTYRLENSGALPSVDTFNSSEFRTKYFPEVDPTDLVYTPGVDCSNTASQQSFNVTATLANGDDYCLD